MKKYSVFWVSRKGETKLSTTRQFEVALRRAWRHLDKQKDTILKIKQPLKGETNLDDASEFVVGWYIPKLTGKVEEITIRIDTIDPVPDANQQASSLQWKEPITIEQARTYVFSDKNDAYKIVTSRINKSLYLGVIANSYARLTWKDTPKIECDVVQFTGHHERDVLEQCMDWLRLNTTPDFQFETLFSSSQKIQETYALQI